MDKISKISKPAKIAIISIFGLLLLFISFYSYSAATDNSAIQKINSFFTGETETEIILEERITHGRKTVNDDSLAAGTTKLRQEGQDGTRRIVVRITKDKDGNEIYRKTINTEISKEPIDEVVAVGTKNTSTSSNSSSSSSNTPSSSPNKSGGSSGSTASGTSKKPGSNSSGSNSPSNSSDKANWLPYNYNSIVNQCKSGVMKKYGHGFYKNEVSVYRGDSGAYVAYGYVYRGANASSGFIGVKCTFEDKTVAGVDYYDSNSMGIWNTFPGHIYTEDEIE